MCMAPVFGIDFGTTNSLASVVLGGRIVRLTGPDGRPHPSVVAYRGTNVLVGREAKRGLAEIRSGVLGDTVRSPKRYLGSEFPIQVAGVPRTPSDVIAELFRFLREHAAREIPGYPLERAIVTIPVSLSGLARADLRQAALKGGVRIVQFVHEPL